MNYHRIIEGILDIGEEMLKSGAENYRLEDALYRMLKSYGFIRYDVFVIPSNIQVSAKTPEGELITQIRHIESFENDFDRLDHLNDLSRYVCADKPDADHLKAKFDKVISLPEQPEILRYVAGVMGGCWICRIFWKWICRCDRSSYCFFNDCVCRKMAEYEGRQLDDL